MDLSDSSPSAIPRSPKIPWWISPAALLFLPFLFCCGGFLVPLFFLVREMLAVVATPKNGMTLLAEPWVWDTVNFTLWQAALSALLSVLCAFPVARFLAHTRFPGRQALLSLSAIPFALPSVIVSFAFVIVYGNSGYLAHWCESMGFHMPTFLYNKWAIVAAHVFFNLPFCMRLLVNQFQSIPAEYQKAAALLNLRFWQVFAYVELPHLIRPAMNALLLVFSMCLSSFAIVMILGGSPEFTTTELAIYQALRFDFDLSAASTFAGIQVCLTLAATLLYRATQSKSVRELQTLSPVRKGFVHKIPRAFQSFLGIFAGAYIVFLVLPLAGIVTDGIQAVSSSSVWHSALASDFLNALVLSLKLACACALLVATLAFGFARGTVLLVPTHPRLARFLQHTSWVFMGVSPTVLSFAWFVLLQRTSGSPMGWGFPAVLFVHTAMALPMASRLVLPAVEDATRETRRAVLALGLSPWKSFWIVEFPALKKALVFAAAIGFAFSFGEAAATSLFGDVDFQTVPTLLFKLMGTYRFADAALLSLLLAFTCGLVFYVSEKYQE